MSVFLNIPNLQIMLPRLEVISIGKNLPTENPLASHASRKVLLKQTPASACGFRCLFVAFQTPIQSPPVSKSLSCPGCHQVPSLPLEASGRADPPALFSCCPWWPVPRHRDSHFALLSLFASLGMYFLPIWLIPKFRSYPGAEWKHWSNALTLMHAGVHVTIVGIRLAENRAALFQFVCARCDHTYTIIQLTCMENWVATRTPWCP